MFDYFKLHCFPTAGTAERIFPEAFEEELSEALARENLKAPWVRRHYGGQKLSDGFAHFRVSDVAVKSAVADALETLGEDMLNHPADEAKDR